MARAKSFLSDSHPHLEAEWSEKNEASFFDFATNSHAKVWWQCEAGHSYEALVLNRAKGQGCGYCSGKKVLEGFNDLQSQAPSIAAEWDFDLNELGPHQVHRGTHKKFYWRCHLGHGWVASVANRNGLHNRNSCPTCAGNVLLKGFNDLLTVRPHLSAKWASELNAEDPHSISLSYGKEVWWRCASCSSTWQRRPELEARRLTDHCEACMRGTSTFELSVHEAMATLLTSHSVVLRDKSLIGPYELDLTFPKTKRAVELNGEYWHGDYNLQKRGFASAKEYHELKLRLCREAGYDLVFLWQDDWEHDRAGMVNAIQLFLEEGLKDPRLTRLESNNEYPGPEKFSEGEETVQTWAQAKGLSLKLEQSEVGLIQVLNDRVGLALNPRAKSSAQLRRLQQSYRARQIDLFYAYPWDNIPLLLAHLESKLSLSARSFAAKRLTLRLVPNQEADAFVKTYHVQGSVRAARKVSLGLYGPNDELLAVQQYSRYRFGTTRGPEDPDSHARWEGLRLCFKASVRIHGGATRMQKFFEDNFNPTEIVSYVDASHSLGNFKTAQGFKDETDWSQESFRWVLRDSPRAVTILDRNSVSRTSDAKLVEKRKILNPNQVAGAFGKGVGRLFFHGPLGSRAELAGHPENGQLTHNDAILEALGYERYYTAGQQKWRKYFLSED